MTSPIYTALFDAIHSAIESAYYDDTTTIHDYAHVATEAAMKACGPRELVWMRNGNHWAGGRGYVIRKMTPNGDYNTLSIRNHFDRNFDTLEAAKAAAQSHADAAHWANTVIGSETA